MKPHGPWKIKQTDEIYKDHFIDVWRDEVVRPDGLDGQHVVVKLKAGVCVLPIANDWKIHLTDEFHYGIGRNSLEAVSGGIETNEDPDETAIRELEEELGLIAAELEYVTTVDPFTTVVTSPTRLYFASNLDEVASRPEGTELIERRTISIEDGFRMVVDGEITHGPSCVLILLAHARFMSQSIATSTQG